MESKCHFRQIAAQIGARRRCVAGPMREPKRSASRARFPAKLRDMARNWPQVLQWDQAERTLIIKDRTRFSKNTTGIKWSSFRRQLGHVRKNDELRFENSKLQDENHMLRKQLKDALKDAEDPLLLSDLVDTPY